MFRGKAKGSHRPGKRAYPLRKIVERDIVGEHGLLYERLECGHLQRPVQDLVGETWADSRRCKQCATSSPGEPKP